MSDAITTTALLAQIERILDDAYGLPPSSCADRITNAVETELDHRDAAADELATELINARTELLEQETEAKRLNEQNTLLIAMLERIPEVHMRFHVVDGELADVCADWCYACKLERAEAERDKFCAAFTTATEQQTKAEAAIARVGKLHARCEGHTRDCDDCLGRNDVCSWCGDAYPCATIAAIDQPAG